MSSRVFVSMPFGEDPDSPSNEWTKLFEYGLRPLEHDIPDLPEGVSHVPVRLWRSDRNLESLALKSNVIQGIERSDFVLCVLTTCGPSRSRGRRVANPNVVWELGYAEAIGKPIVVLADGDDLVRLPILAGLPNVCIYDHDLVRRVRVKDAPQVLATIARSLVQHIARASDEAKRGPIGPQGSRARFYPSRDAVDLPGMISAARRQVDILTTNLQYFLSDAFRATPDPIGLALKNGAAVRIVTMDPESVIAEFRAKQLVRGHDVPGYRRELRNGIIDFFTRFGDHPNFHLHIYNDLPLQITTRVDHTIVTSVVTVGERARKRIQIQFGLHDEGVTDSFVGHFQSMFDNSTDASGLKWVVRPDAQNGSPRIPARQVSSPRTRKEAPNKRIQRTRRRPHKAGKPRTRR